MCGIAGLVGWRIDQPRARGMIETLAHRGPDALGHWFGGTPDAPVYMGHARLSIIDLSERANQPFVKGPWSLIYNGELYNFKNLRSELESYGATFRTESDTEVLLEAWRHWGPKALPRLRGMFAFALYNAETRSLVLVRDHFGIKPLFYLDDGKGFAFASELKAIRSVMTDPQENETALVSALMFSWVPESQCMIRGVKKLPPGCWLEYRGGRSTVHRYFDPIAVAHEAAETGLATPVSAADLGEVMRDSVTAHLVADVPVSAFLSGGLDSSLITVLATQANSDVDSYTVSFRPEDQKFEAMPDDLAFARRLSASHGITTHEVAIDPDIVSLLPKMVYHLDEPIGDAAAINAFLICQAAREAGVKVLLSGMGADELFGGYRRHYAALMAARYRKVPAVLRTGLIEPATRALPAAGKTRGYRAFRWGKRFIEFGGLDEEAAFRRSYAHYGPAELANLLAIDVDDSIAQLVEEHRATYESYVTSDTVNKMCLADVQMFLPGLNLAYTDRASMAASTEVRVPFVDVEVFKTAFAIPGRRKIAGRERKAILKEASLKWIPRDIAYRPKGLFSAPLRAWMRRDLVEMVDDHVLNGANVSSGLLDKASVQRMVADDRLGRSDYSKEIWQLLTLEIWRSQLNFKAAV